MYFNMWKKIILYCIKAWKTFILNFSPFLSGPGLSGVSDAAAESRRGRRLLFLRLFWFFHLPGCHGAVGGVFVSRWRGHVSWTRLCIRVLLSEQHILMVLCHFWQKLDFLQNSAVNYPEDRKTTSETIWGMYLSSTCVLKSY